ncbi:MAG: hypothetical protein P9L99_03405 [Candidatus Lernaella stagnicola]|nr:hypothetical protein [Candidatus Lernaella stagnicola]
MRRFGLFFLLTVVGTFLSCATTMPPHLSNPAAHPKFPVSEYITGVGMSDTGFSDAENLAKLKVSEQVRSYIESSFEQHMTEKFNKISWQIKKHTKFTHAEMIRIDTTSGAKVGQLYYAFAYLPRKDVFRVLSGEYEAEATKFRRSAQSLPTLHADLPAYTAGLRQSQKSFAALAAKAFEIRAVTLKEPTAFQADDAVFLAMERDRVALLRGLKITVRIENGNVGDAREVILMAVTGALTRLGLEATPGVCDPQKHELLVKAEVKCKRGSFGPQCKLDIAGALVHCSSGAVLAEADLNDPSFKGLHTKDQSRALTQLYNTITAEALTPLLQKALAGVLPIDEQTADDGSM